MTTSRAIGIVGIAENLDLAEQIAEKAVSAVKGPSTIGPTSAQRR